MSKMMNRNKLYAHHKQYLNCICIREQQQK